MTTFTKADLRAISEHLASLRPPGPRPLTADQLVKINEVIEKAHHLIATTRAAPERGELIFEWRVPREHALTLNQYAQAKGWQKKKLAAAMDDAIQKLLPLYPKALLHGAKTKRWLRATRFSTKVTDEVTVDVLGGKMPCDRIVRAGILADDDAAHVIREARSEKTKPGNTHLLVQVFTIVEHQVDTPEPSDHAIEQLVRTPGLMTQMLIDGRGGST